LSRSFETQKRELLLRLVAYNIDRKLILSIFVLRVSPKPPNDSLINFRK